jgi:hypothetical protein
MHKGDTTMIVRRNPMQAFPSRLSPPLSAVAFCALWLVGVDAVAGTFEPVTPDSGRVPLSQVIQEPDSASWANGSASVNCQVLVTAKGRTSAAKCGVAETGAGAPDSVLGATYVGLRRAKFKPATVDGNAVDVVASMRVDIKCIGQNCDVRTYPNLGLYRDRYGYDYTAPQEVLNDRKTWYERLLLTPVCTEGKGKGKPIEPCVDEGAFKLVVYMDVDTEGRASNLRARRNPLTAQADEIMTEVERVAVESVFIPAMHDGQAVEATLLSTSLHYENNRSIPKSICVEDQELGSRLPKTRCYNPQQHARVSPSLQIYSWLPLTTGSARQ